MLDVLFRLDLAGGRCVAVRIPAALDDAQLEALPPAERAIARDLPAPRRPSWVAGRTALRAAAADVGRPVDAVTATDRGAPALPAGVAGSISHKRDVAIGLAVPRDGDLQVGVDVEVDVPPRVDIARRILTDAEAARVAALPADERPRRALLHLSAKESLYKGLDPYVRRYVGFKEAEVTFHDDGRFSVVLGLTRDDGAFDTQGWWVLRVGLILTAARVRGA